MSHGICLACVAVVAGNPIEDLSHVQPELLDALPYGVIQLSGDGIITAYSQGESMLSGLSPESVIGKNFFRAGCALHFRQEFSWDVRRIADENAKRER